MFYLFVILSSILISCGSVASSAGITVSDIKKNRKISTNDLDRALEYLEDSNDFELFKLLQENPNISNHNYNDGDILDIASKNQQLDVVKMLLAAGIFDIERIANSEGRIKDLYNNTINSIKELRRGINGDRGDKDLKEFEKAVKDIFHKSIKRKSLPNDKKEQLNSEKRSELEKKKEILEKDIAALDKEIKIKTSILNAPEGVADLSGNDMTARDRLNFSDEIFTLTKDRVNIKKELRKVNNVLQNISRKEVTPYLEKKSETSVEDYLKDMMLSQELYTSDSKVENSPLLIALIILFKENNFSLDFDGEDGRAISSFIDQEYLKSIELIYYAGANFHYSNLLGNTPLHISALKLNKDICTLLIKIGLDKTVKNSEGETPFNIANSKMKKKSIVDDELLNLLK